MSRCGNCDGVTRCRNVTGLKSVAAFDMAQQMVVGAHDHRLPGYFRATRPFKGGGVTERVGVLEQHRDNGRLRYAEHRALGSALVRILGCRRIILAKLVLMMLHKIAAGLERNESQVRALP